MKKIFVILTMFLLLALGVSALVKYTGIPQFPYLVYGNVNWNSQFLGGVRVELTNQNTGYSTIIITNIDGYWQEDGSNWLTNNVARPPIIFGDNIKVKTLDGCGSADTCEVTFSAFSAGNENFARKDLSVTGALLPSPSPSGGGGGGGSSGGSGGGGSGSVPAWTCQEWTTCDNGQQTRICTLNQYTSKEKRICVIPEPIVIKPEEPVITPPVVVLPEQYTCSDGTKVDKKEDCPIKSKEHEEVIVEKINKLKVTGIIGASLAALIIGLYLWRRRKGKFETAEKGAKTFIDKRTK